MLIYDIHSHLGKTSSGDENTPQELVNDLAAYGISRVGISSLSGISMRDQNDLVHRAMEAYPGVIKGYGFINPKAGDAIDEVNRCLGDYHMVESSSLLEAWLLSGQYACIKGYLRRN